MSEKDKIRNKAEETLLKTGRGLEAEKAFKDLTDAINDRAASRKGIKVFEVMHEIEVSRLAFLRVISHGKTISEALASAEKSIEIMLGVQVLQVHGWTWVSSEPDKPIYAGLGVIPRPSSELEKFRAEHPTREFRAAYKK